MKRPPTGPQHLRAAAVVHSCAEATPPPPRALSSRPGVLMRGPTSAVSSGGWSPMQSVQGAGEAAGEAGVGVAAEQSGTSMSNSSRAVRRSLKGLELFGEAVGGPDPVPPAAMAAARASWPSTGRGEDIAAAARDGVASLVRAARDGLQGGFGRGSVAGGCLAEAPDAQADPADGSALRIVQLQSHRGDRQQRDGNAAAAGGSLACEGAAAEAGATAEENNRSDEGHDRGHQTHAHEMGAAGEWLPDSGGGDSADDCLAVNGRGKAARDGSSGAAAPAGGHASSVRPCCALAALSWLVNPVLPQPVFVDLA